MPYLYQILTYNDIKMRNLLLKFLTIIFGFTTFVYISFIHFMDFFT